MSLPLGPPFTHPPAPLSTSPRSTGLSSLQAPTSYLFCTQLCIYVKFLSIRFSYVSHKHFNPITVYNLYQRLGVINLFTNAFIYHSRIVIEELSQVWHFAKTLYEKINETWALALRHSESVEGETRSLTCKITIKGTYSLGTERKEEQIAGTVSLN